MSDTVDLAARRLREAAESAQPTEPVSDVVADLEMAYAVQARNHEIAVSSGRRISGYKIGLTATPIQEFFGVDAPAFGALFDDMCVATGEVVARERLMQPRLEGEVAIVLGADLDRGDYDLMDVASATAHVLPAIEIVDCRIANWKLTIVDMVADNAGGGLYVLGDTPVSLDDLDLTTIPMSLAVDGEERSSGIGSACLGNPLGAAAWLANELVARGMPLRAGMHIITGALGPMVEMPPQQPVTASFGQLGSVTTTWGHTPD